MIGSIEFAQMEQKIFEGLKQGNQVLQEINSQMSIEEVENLMLDTEEAIAYQNEISEILSGKLTNEDEDAIEEEYAALEKAALAENMPDAPQEDLPEQPKAEKTAQVQTKKQKKEAQLVPG